MVQNSKEWFIPFKINHPAAGIFSISSSVWVFPSHSPSESESPLSLPSGPQPKSHLADPVTQCLKSQTQDRGGKKPKPKNLKLDWACSDPNSGQRKGKSHQKTAVLLVYFFIILIYLGYLNFFFLATTSRGRSQYGRGRSARNQSPNSSCCNSFTNSNSCTFGRTSLDKHFPSSPWQKVNICI